MDFRGGEKRRRAESAGADAFFYADNFAAIETVGGGGEERVSCGEALAAAFGESGCIGAGGGEGGVGLEF